MGSTPKTPQTVELDEGTRGLIKDATTRAIRPAEDYLKELNQPADYAAKAFEAPNTAQASATTGQDEGFLKALQNKHSQVAKSDFDRIKSMNTVTAEQKRAGQMSRMAQIAQGQQQARTQQYAFLTEVYNQQEAAKAGMINELFQLGSAVMMGAGGGKKPPKDVTQPTGLEFTGGFDPRNLA